MTAPWASVQPTNTPHVYAQESGIDVSSYGDQLRTFIVAQTLDGAVGTGIHVASGILFEADVEPSSESGDET